MQKIAVFAIAALFAAVANASDTYKIQVTRKAQDLYAIEGQGNSIYIKTSFCYEFAMWEEAILILNTRPFSGSIAIGKLIFPNSSTTCQVDTVIS